MSGVTGCPRNRRTRLREVLIDKIPSIIMAAEYSRPSVSAGLASCPPPGYLDLRMAPSPVCGSACDSHILHVLDHLSAPTAPDP